MAGYAKLFSSITESSLWCVGSKEARLLFVSMMARADEAGVVEASIPGLAKLASLTVDEAVNAVNELESPDPYDRSGVAEGRRITKVEGGWALVNYAVYRDMKSSSERREYMKTYMREYRKKGVNNVNANVNNVNANVNARKPVLAPATATASATATAKEITTSSPSAVEQSGGVGKRIKNPKMSQQQIDDIYAAYPRKEKPRDAKLAIEKAFKAKETKEAADWHEDRDDTDNIDMVYEFLLERTIRYATYCANDESELRRNGQNYIPYPASWFNAQSYLIDHETNKHILQDAIPY